MEHRTAPLPWHHRRICVLRQMACCGGWAAIMVHVSRGNPPVSVVHRAYITHACLCAIRRTLVCCGCVASHHHYHPLSKSHMVPIHLPRVPGYRAGTSGSDARSVDDLDTHAWNPSASVSHLAQGCTIPLFAIENPGKVMYVPPGFARWPCFTKGEITMVCCIQKGPLCLGAYE